MVLKFELGVGVVLKITAQVYNFCKAMFFIESNIISNDILLFSILTFDNIFTILNNCLQRCLSFLSFQ